MASVRSAGVESHAEAVGGEIHGLVRSKSKPDCEGTWSNVMIRSMRSAAILCRLTGVVDRCLLSNLPFLSYRGCQIGNDIACPVFP